MLVKCNATLEYLLQQGARVHDVDDRGHSALYWACFNNNPNCITTLLKHGADVNGSDNNGNTHLHHGAHYANLEVIKALVASPQCDVNVKNNKGQTALDVARSKPHYYIDYEPVIEYLENIQFSL